MNIRGLVLVLTMLALWATGCGRSPSATRVMEVKFKVPDVAGHSYTISLRQPAIMYVEWKVKSGPSKTEEEWADEVFSLSERVVLQAKPGAYSGKVSAGDGHYDIEIVTDHGPMVYRISPEQSGAPPATEDLSRILYIMRGLTYW